MTDRVKLVIDILERAVATFLEAFVGFFVASGVFDQLAVGHWALALSATQRAALAAIPAALSIIKGALSSFAGKRDSAAALPASVD